MRTKNLPSDIDLSNIFEKECVYCGDTFYTDNENCIYCKDSCKSLAYQERKECNAYVKDEKYRDTNKNLPLKEPINTDEVIDSYIGQIDDLEEQLRLSEARNRISDKEFGLLSAVCADKWFKKIYSEPMKISFDDINKNCHLLGEMLVHDIGECELNEHGFKTSNFALLYICDNKKRYTIGEENKNDYLLTKKIKK